MAGIMTRKSSVKMSLNNYNFTARTDRLAHRKTVESQICKKLAPVRTHSSQGATRCSALPQAVTSRAVCVACASRTQMGFVSSPHSRKRCRLSHKRDHQSRPRWAAQDPQSAQLQACPRSPGRVSAPAYGLARTQVWEPCGEGQLRALGERLVHVRVVHRCPRSPSRSPLAARLLCQQICHRGTLPSHDNDHRWGLLVFSLTVVKFVERLVHSASTWCKGASLSLSSAHGYSSSWDVCIALK